MGCEVLASGSDAKDAKDRDMLEHAGKNTVLTGVHCFLVKSYMIAKVADAKIKEKQKSFLRLEFAVFLLK